MANCRTGKPASSIRWFPEGKGRTRLQSPLLQARRRARRRMASASWSAWRGARRLRGPPHDRLYPGHEVGGQLAKSRRDAAGEHDPEPEPPERAARSTRTPRGRRTARSLWGMLETKHGGEEARPTGKPVPTWMPKMIDSGTPSTTEPTTMPIAPPAPAAPKRRSTTRSPTRKTATPISIHRPNCQLSSTSSASATRSKEIAAISAPAPKPASDADEAGRNLDPAGEQAGKEQG